MRVLHEALTDRIVAGYYAVRRQLPHGLAVTSYRNALAVECRRAGIRTALDATFDVRYYGEIVGRYEADLVVDNVVLVHVRQDLRFTSGHRDHLLGCLRASGLPVGLALNFGERADVCRSELWPVAARVAERNPGFPADGW